MITNANIAKVVAENCPGAFELEDVVSHTRGLEIHHGPNGCRAVLVRQLSFTFTEIANLVCDFELAGCDVDVNIVPCPEDSQVVTLEVELSPGVEGSDDWWWDHVDVPDAHGGEPQPGIDFDKIRQKLRRHEMYGWGRPYFWQQDDREGKVYVPWPDGYLHVFETLCDYEDPNVEPIEILGPCPDPENL